MRTFRKVMSVLFALMSIVLSYPLVSSVLYHFSIIKHLFFTDSAGIIGGVDFKIFISYILVPTIITMVILISLAAFNVFNIIFAFREKASFKIRISLFIWCVLNVGALMRRPIILTASWNEYLFIAVVCIVTLLTIISNISSKEKSL